MQKMYLSECNIALFNINVGLKMKIKNLITGGAGRFRSKNLPRFPNEVDVKYGSRDVSEGS